MKSTPTKKKAVKKSALKEAKPAYSITFTMGDKSYTGEGASVLEALANIPRPIKIMTKGLVTVSDGVKVFSQMYMPVRAKRLFYPICRPVLARQLDLLLK